MSSIQKYVLEEKIRLLYAKYRGNILAIAEEANLSIDYVKKIANKIKKKCSRDVSYLISQTLMEYIIMGHKQRVVYLEDCLQKMEGEERTRASSCCKALVIEHTVNNDNYFICTRCNKICSIIFLPQGDIFKLKLDIIESLREEDVALVSFAEKMGYTNKEPVPVQKIQQNIVYLSDASKADQITANEIADLPPREREKIRKKLERSITKAELVELIKE